MKHLSSSCFKLVAFAACALTLGSCNRAEYATLPKTTSYHGVARVAAPVPAEPAIAVAPAEQPAVAPTPPAAPVAAQAAAPPATAIVAAPAAKISPAAASSPAVTEATPTPLHKLKLVQRLAVAKVGKQLRKAVDLAQFKQKENATAIQRISGYLRTGIILLLVGLLVGIFNKFIGGIIALLGVIFIVLWLLDNL